jgi:hypothetical protein
MAFSETTVEQAWKRAGGKCECRRKRHNHNYGVCHKTLVWGNRGREGRGAWEAHHINSALPALWWRRIKQL